jgi:alpha-1,6-mannosyl-glycoprotein beta-1,2-N-acetylglucosaminyltransferase
MEVSLARRNIPVLFVEEDHFLLPDALFLLDELWALRAKVCTLKCPVVAIAHHELRLTEDATAYQKYFIAEWSGNSNIGVALDYDSFLAVVNCSETFCAVDDYNWDWSMHFLMTRCLNKTFQMIVAKAPRVLHIGACQGLHYKTACDMDKNVQTAKSEIEKLRQTKKLFPPILKFQKITINKLRNQKENGGWGDPRDQALCRNMTKTFSQTPI